MEKYYIEVEKTDGEIVYLDKHNSLVGKPSYWGRDTSARYMAQTYTKSKAYKRIAETINKITVKESEYKIPTVKIEKKAEKLDDGLITSILNSGIRIKYTPNDDKIDERMAIATDFIQHINDYANDQYVMVEKEDQLTLDLLHKIELTKFNACDGYKMAKELKECRLRRREHKDRFLKLSAFATDVKNVDFAELTKKNAELSNREYNPRVLTKESERSNDGKT